MSGVDAEEPLDVVGIGVGPSNLSLAALLDARPSVRAQFFERREQLRWHPGLQLPESDLQVSFLKDLVTLVNPTNRFTFLNFLAETGRLHRFAAMPWSAISRIEFESYYAWAAGHLSNVTLGEGVRDVTYDGGAFVVRTDSRVSRARDLCIGAGPVPSVPSCAKGRLGSTMWHAADCTDNLERTAGARVVVVGGGQSGAEVVAHLLDRAGDQAVRSITWLSRRPGFLPLDDSPFTNEWFQPDYVRYFRDLAPERRRELLVAQQLSSDGISVELLQRIYRRVYHNDFVATDRVEHAFVPGVEMLDVQRRWDHWRLDLRHQDTGAATTVDADVVILATGYRYQLPHCLSPLSEHLPLPERHGLPLREDYSLPWKHAATNRLFFMNAGRHSHGIADPNLSLASWRAATVANAVGRSDLYSLPSSQTVSRWHPIGVPGGAASDATGEARPHDYQEELLG